MNLINHTTSPLIEKFAQSCSDEYSRTVDRKAEIAAYIMGESAEFPSLMNNSNIYSYRTMEALKRMSGKVDEHVFTRAAGIVLRTGSNQNRVYYRYNQIFDLATGDTLLPRGLGARSVIGAERLDQAVERLRLIVQYAGDAVIQSEIKSRQNHSAFGTKNTGHFHSAAGLLLLLKAYKALNPEYVQEKQKELPPLLQALLDEDQTRLQAELDQVLERVVIQQLPLKDNLSTLDLEPQFLQAKRDAVQARRFPSSAYSASQHLQREVFYDSLLQIHSAFMYAIHLKGGKEVFLKELDETGQLLLEAVRDLHEVLPLEVRSNLLELDDKAKNPQSLLAGIVPLDEPYPLIEQLGAQLQYFTIAWNTLKAAVQDDPARSGRALEIMRRPYPRAFLRKVLEDNSADLEAIPGNLEQLVLQSISDLSNKNKHALSLIRYLSGELSLESYLSDDNKLTMFDSRDRDTSRRSVFIAISFLPLDSQAYRRFVLLLCHPDTRTAGLLAMLYKSFDFSGEQLLAQYENDPEVDGEQLLLDLLMLNGQQEYDYVSIPRVELGRIIQSHMANSLKFYKKLPTDTRLTLLETAYTNRDSLPTEEYAESLRLGLTDSSKQANQLAQSEFTRNPDRELYVNLYKADNKASLKELVLNGLRELPGASQAYEELLAYETSEALKQLIQVLLNTEGQSPTAAHAALAKLTDAKRMSRLNWLPLDHLPALRGQGGEELDEGIPLYLLVQSLDFATEPNPRLAEVREYADSLSLADFSAEILSLWIQNQAPAKEKWVLFLSALFGDRRVIELLAAQIKEWTENSRGAIAAEAVRALSYVNDKAALMTIDRVKRSVKNRQVKGAAEEALSMAAENMGLTQEELEDRLVTSLGFDEAGTLSLSYGERAFTVKVTGDLQLSVLNEETGKEVKSLPAPAQKDDAELAAQAKKTFTQLKKDLKMMVAIQSQRVEESLSKQRLWTLEAWRDLFVHNVIMRKFSIGLVWAVYRDGKLADTFRYMEDGTFNTVDEDEYEFADGVLIGLIHPVELDQETLAAWRTQLEDYEITQPFEQLNRTVYKPGEEDSGSRAYTALPEEDFSPTAFPKVLEKYGWYKGAAQDGGMYFEFYKEYGELIAELKFSGASISYYEGMEDITLESLAFFTNRHSTYYYYDQTQGLYLDQVPTRVYSETLYDIMRATGR
ncbi:DUF4132 domain-containing protein [Paenibacillus donghaensis]|uniref:DUF4132 domain-containing protein n=1 Tax=Paenibacillus donghaensis TaxID=414771 RepID=A0A2Z2KH06_9BACL|nr:DUF4132 domain-containing protein [Paenibacillus donghaensis]ASA21449.1 hypothetical protein B9T62_12080 [Paenibacillus donghaensis]